jgi:hypothetical protein
VVWVEEAGCQACGTFSLWVRELLGIVSRVCDLVGVVTPLEIVCSKCYISLRILCHLVVEAQEGKWDSPKDY